MIGGTDQRILICSPRAGSNLSPAISPQIEFEDLICEFDDVELISPPPRSNGDALQKVHNRLAKIAHTPGRFNLSFHNVSPRCDEYEMFFCAVLCPDDLLAVNAIDGWRKRSRVAVAWVIEAWLQDLDNWKGHWDVLSKFDHVFVTMEPCRERVAQLTGRPVHHLPYAADGLLFSPLAPGLDRPIDVFSFGRKSPRVHEKLLSMARSDELYYLYDSIYASKVKDHVEHRYLLATQAKRSKFIIANRGKIAADDETGGQEEFGGRFFDSAAAGAIFVGEFPQTDDFRAQFDWEDAGLALGWEEDPQPLIERARADPDWLAAASSRSIIHSLARHDWVHRWRTILDVAGLDQSEGMAQRFAALCERADRFS